MTLLRVTQALVARGRSAVTEREREKLVWTNQAERLLRLPPMIPGKWVGAFQRDLVLFGGAAPLHTPMAPAPAFPAIAVVMMVKDEADIIGQNLAWLHRAGIRRFIVSDNASTDGTADRVRAFRDAHADAEVVTVHDPLVRFIQAEKTSGLYRFAMSIWPDVRWIAPIDADEFLIAERGLDVLDTVSAHVDALVIPKTVHFRTTAFMQTGVRSTDGMDLRSPFSFAPPKVMARVDPLLGFAQGNHKIQFLDARRPIYTGGLAHGLYLREFPNRSFEHFLRKVSNGGPAIKAARDHTGVEAGGWHWTALHRILSQTGAEGLLETYRQQCVRVATDGFIYDPFPPDKEGEAASAALSRAT